MDICFVPRVSTAHRRSRLPVTSPECVSSMSNVGKRDTAKAGKLGICEFKACWDGKGFTVHELRLGVLGSRLKRLKVRTLSAKLLPALAPQMRKKRSACSGAASQAYKGVIHVSHDHYTAKTETATVKHNEKTKRNAEVKAQMCALFSWG